MDLIAGKKITKSTLLNIKLLDDKDDWFTEECETV